MASPSHPPPRPTFTLAGLLELIAGIGLFLALVTQLEWAGFVMALVGFLILAVVHYVAFAESRSQAARNAWGCFMAVLMLLLVMVLLLPAVSSAREAGRRTLCRSNLKQVALAFHNYLDNHGHFPPPYVADAAGKPMHSWRVLILPYLERLDLYNAYNFNEPWDGPNNSKLAAQMPQAFRCPSDPKMPPGMTSYFCIVGPARLKEGRQRLKMKDISDGTANTIMLVESSSARVNWLEPTDLKVEDILAGQNTAQTPCPCSRHGEKPHGMWRREQGYGFVAANFDASVQFLPANIDRETLRSLLTIGGGEKIDLDALVSFDGEHLWPGFWVLLAVEIAFVGMAIVRRVRIGRRLREEARQ